MTVASITALCLTVLVVGPLAAYILIGIRATRRWFARNASDRP